MKYSRKNVTINCLKISFVILFILLGISNIKLLVADNQSSKTIAKLEVSKKELKAQLIASNDKVTVLSSELKSSEAVVMYQYNVNKELNETNKALDKQISKLKKVTKKLNKELDNSISRLTTYEKYKYVVFNKAGKRTDVTYEQLKTGEQMMKKKGYDPDLLFSIVMVESTGRANAYNRGSGAAGYGQFMPRTGEFVYEKLLKLGTYNHNTTPKNGDINIKMVAKYIEYLYSKYDGNIVRGIREYCGGGSSFTASYISKVDSYLPKKSVYGLCLCKK